MCSKAEFARLRDQIAELARSDVRQTEQIKTLFAASKAQSASIDSMVRHQQRLLSRLILAIAGVLLTVVVFAVFALGYGALGPKGFNAVRDAAGERPRQSAALPGKDGLHAVPGGPGFVPAHGTLQTTTTTQGD